MKICNKCGSYQSDDQFFCIDCGEKLGSSISDEEAKKIKNQTELKIDKLYNRTDPLNVSAFYRACGISALIGAASAVVLSIVFRNRMESALSALYSVILFVLCALNALVPKLLWNIDKFRLSFIINGSEDAEPSYFYFITRKITIIGSFVFAVIILIISIVCFINPDALYKSYYNS